MEISLNHKWRRILITREDAIPQSLWTPIRRVTNNIIENCWNIISCSLTIWVETGETDSLSYLQHIAPTEYERIPLSSEF